MTPVGINDWYDRNVSGIEEAVWLWFKTKYRLVPLLIDQRSWIDNIWWHLWVSMIGMTGMCQEWRRPFGFDLKQNIGRFLYWLIKDLWLIIPDDNTCGYQWWYDRNLSGMWETVWLYSNSIGRFLDWLIKDLGFIIPDDNTDTCGYQWLVCQECVRNVRDRLAFD